MRDVSAAKGMPLAEGLADHPRHRAGARVRPSEAHRSLRPQARQHFHLQGRHGEGARLRHRAADSSDRHEERRDRVRSGAVRLRGLTPAYASLEMWSSRFARSARRHLRARVRHLRAAVRAAIRSTSVPRRWRSSAISRRARIELADARAVGEPEEGTRAAARASHAYRQRVSSRPSRPQSRLAKYALPGAVVAVLATVAALGSQRTVLPRRRWKIRRCEVLQCAQIPKPAAVADRTRAATALTPEQQQEIEDDIAAGEGLPARCDTERHASMI